MRFIILIATLMATAITTDASGQRFAPYGLKPVDQSDTLGKFLDLLCVRTPLENEKHKLVWKVMEVRDDAIYLAKKGIQTFTMMDETPTNESPYYVIGFYGMLESHYMRLSTYRISKDLTMELYSFDDDSWSKVEY